MLCVLLCTRERYTRGWVTIWDEWLRFLRRPWHMSWLLATRARLRWGSRSCQCTPRIFNLSRVEREKLSRCVVGVRRSKIDGSRLMDCGTPTHDMQDTTKSISIIKSASGNIISLEVVTVLRMVAWPLQAVKAPLKHHKKISSREDG